MSPWRKALSAPGAILMGGLGFWAMAWALDLWTHVEEFGVGEGVHAHGGSALIRLNFPLTGAPLILFGLAQLIGTEALLKRGGIPLFAASFLLLTDGLAHAFAFNDHLGELAAASFFAALAPAQIGAGLALPFIPRRYDRWFVAFALGLIALWAVSRAAAFEPLRWPERIEALDVFSKFLEVLLVVTLLVVIRATPSTGSAVSPQSGAAEDPAGVPSARP
jgi:hypothetical protein